MESNGTQCTGGQDDIAIIAIGASQGGIQALWRIVQDLPGDFSVPILIVQHLSPHHPSSLDQVIQSRSALRVKWATDGEQLQGGTIYLAPPNRHLLVEAPGVAKLASTDKINWVRPAADVLFESVAQHYGRRGLAVVLTGNLHDGTAGAVSIKRAGGWVLAQDEDSSQRFDMPRSAIRSGAVDYVLPVEMLSFAILSLTMTFGATSLFRTPCRLLSPRTLDPMGFSGFESMA